VNLLSNGVDKLLGDVGRVLGTDIVDRFTTVYYGYMRDHSFNLVRISFDSDVVYTLYLDGNTKNPCFRMEKGSVAKEKIMELLNGL
jgi:hypothetical protein